MPIVGAVEAVKVPDKDQTVAVKAPEPKEKESPAPKKHHKPAKTMFIDGTKTGVTVVGILKVGKGYRAILKGGSRRKKSLLSPRASMWAAWLVDSITADNVIIKGNGYVAKCHLDESAGSPGKKKDNGEKGDKDAGVPVLLHSKKKRISGNYKPGFVISLSRQEKETR